MATLLVGAVGYSVVHQIARDYFGYPNKIIEYIMELLQLAIFLAIFFIALVGLVYRVGGVM